MARENETWGFQRIQRLLLKLDHRVVQPRFAGSSRCGVYSRHPSDPPMSHGDGPYGRRPRPCSPWTSSRSTSQPPRSGVSLS